MQLSTFGSKMMKMTISLAYVVACIVLICSEIALGVNLIHNYMLAEEGSDWEPATATWYGSPNGDGSEGNVMSSYIKFIIDY